MNKLSKQSDTLIGSTTTTLPKKEVIQVEDDGVGVAGEWGLDDDIDIQEPQ